MGNIVYKLLKDMTSQKKKKKILSILLDIFSYSKILALLCLLWFIFSGNRDLFLICCGIISVIMTFFICIRYKIISPDTYIVKLGFFKYIYRLLRDICISTIQMIKIIYSKNIQINPGTTIVNVSRLSNQEKVLFSNLITMTPGTFVIAVEGNNFLIHALNRNNLNFRNNYEITKLLKKMR